MRKRERGREREREGEKYPILRKFCVQRSNDAGSQTDSLKTKWAFCFT